MPKVSLEEKVEAIHSELRKVRGELWVVLVMVFMAGGASAIVLGIVGSPGDSFLNILGRASPFFVFAAIVSFSIKYFFQRD